MLWERFEGLPRVTAWHGAYVCDLEDAVRFLLLVVFLSLFFVERACFLVDAYRGFPRELPPMPRWDNRRPKKCKPTPAAAARLSRWTEFSYPEM
jgi:hypothetical protein